MHAEFYFDYILEVNEGVGDILVLQLGTIVGDDDDTSGGASAGVVGGTSDVGVNSRPCGFTKYNDYHISTQDPNHGIRPQEQCREGKETQDHDSTRHGYGTYGYTNVVEERLRLLAMSDLFCEGFDWSYPFDIGSNHHGHVQQEQSKSSSTDFSHIQSCPPYPQLVKSFPPFPHHGEFNFRGPSQSLSNPQTNTKPIDIGFGESSQSFSHPQYDPNPVETDFGESSQSFSHPQLVPIQFEYIPPQHHGQENLIGNFTNFFFDGGNQHSLHPTPYREYRARDKDDDNIGVPDPPCHSWWKW